MYIHKELRFVCDRCGMGFPFESRLSQHKITHRTYASLKCMKKNCGRCFKNIGDLNRHVNQHKRGSTVTYATIKIRIKGTQTLTKGYMLLVMKNTVVKNARNGLDLVLRD